MRTHTELKNHDGYLDRSCSIFTSTKVGSSACVHCRFFVNADDKGSPTWVQCFEWDDRDTLNRDLIILIREVTIPRNGLYGLSGRPR